MKNVELKTQSTTTVRKPYEKPMIIYRQPMEARATVCSAPGKSDTTCTTAFS
jgi:hypothetical protein